MAELRIPSTYDDERIPAQRAFRLSQAKIRGYGGAMGGGKSFALCQEAFDWALEYPGILLPIFRQKHTAIVNTTRKTLLEQVIPPELLERTDLIRIKQSQGEDLIEFKFNGSQIHLVGLDDPGKWFSSEIGGVMFDEAHEMDEKDVVTLMSRLRQRCRACNRAKKAGCTHMPRQVVLAFNPAQPGHWLQQWCILGAQRTEYGWARDTLLPEGADNSIGNLEFFLSRATDNPFLPPGYVDQSLAGMSAPMRRRYLEGLWEHISGEGFFDQDALSLQTSRAMERSPVLIGEPVGDPSGGDQEQRPSIRPARNGRAEVFARPVRNHTTDEGEEVLAHRYVVAVDASSGASADWSAVQVLDCETWEQACEWQGKVDPDQLGVIAFLLAVVYNGAVIAPEVTGGWGFAVTKRVQKLTGQWKGSKQSQPRLYTRPVTDRLSDKFTDMLGWDTNRKTRAHALTLLEEALREDTIQVHGQRTLAELASFAFPEHQGLGDYKAPAARKGSHDDLVLALAIGLAVAERTPRKRYTEALAMRY